MYMSEIILPYLAKAQADEYSYRRFGKCCSYGFLRYSLPNLRFQRNNFTEMSYLTLLFSCTACVRDNLVIFFKSMNSGQIVLDMPEIWL